MEITIQIGDKDETFDAAVPDVFVESAGVVCVTTPIDESELTIRGLMDEVFLKLTRLERENEKLSADSKVLGKIIKVVDGFDHNPDACMADICEIVDERGD